MNNKRLRKIDGTHSNIASAIDNAAHGPQIIEFFGRTAILMSTPQFLSLLPADLTDIQLQIREHMMREGVALQLSDPPPAPQPLPKANDLALGRAVTPPNAPTGL